MRIWLHFKYLLISFSEKYTFMKEESAWQELRLDQSETIKSKL